MIVVRLAGGLGNQMFQYAAARRLALKHGAELRLDLSFLDARGAGGVARPYFLRHLRVEAAPASEADVARLYGHGRTLPGRARTRMLRLLGAAPAPRVVEERAGGYDPSLLDAPDESYLIGYWQSERYFDDIAPRLREEFEVADPPSGANLETAEAIRSCASVGVHVRRGDYASDPAVRRVHGLCDAAYFRAAAARVAERVPGARFFVFSDEPGWARENLSLGLPATFVGHNPPGVAHEDLRLMRLCAHQVLSNSSFGWWAAWLADRPGKIVVAPRRWYADPALAAADPVPAGWDRL